MNSEIPSRRGPLLAVLFFGVLMAALDIAMLGPAKPAIQDTFSLDERDGVWIFNAFVLLNLAGVPVMSKLADLFGRRRIFMLVVITFAVGSLIVATAPGFEVLLIGRALQGLSVSGIFPVAAAVVGDVFEPDRRGRALGVLGAVFGVAFIVGPIIAGILLPYGWRLIYFSYLPLAAAIWIFAYRLIPETIRDRSTTLDVTGVVLLSSGLLGLSYAISRIDPAMLGQSILEWDVLAAFALAAVTLPLFVRVESVAPDPLIRLSMFRNSQIAISSLIAVGAGIVEAAFIYFPTVAGLAMGVSRSTAAFMLVPLSFAIAVGSPIAGRLLDRIGSRAIVLMSNATLVVGMAGVALWPASRVAFFASTVCVGLGLAGILGSALSYILLHEARVEDRTAAQGLITLFISIGQLVGAAAVGSVAASMGESVHGYSFAFLGISAAMVLVSFVSFRLKRRVEETKVVMGA